MGNQIKDEVGAVIATAIFIQVVVAVILLVVLPFLPQPAQ
jgi:Mg/Co/Ni transporter MgtE